MKKALILILILSATVVAYCATRDTSIVLKVVDDDGEPVEGALINPNFYLSESGGESALTDENGVAVIEGDARIGFSFKITKSGYYESVGSPSSSNQTLDVVLREMRNPIAMYAKKFIFPKPIENPYTYFYDFLRGDFLPPYGQGVVADIEINGAYTRQDSWNYSGSIDILFVGEGNGIRGFELGSGKWYSDFDSDHEATASGFIDELNFYSNRNGRGTPVDTNFERKSDYYFRIRTELDEEGNVASALYGKIYGEFNRSGGFSFYVNPTPNDRNMEFDPRQNLFTGLPQEERVYEP
jgi:hypothetical protein